MSEQKGNLTLYTAGTPNGWKPSITLEELGLQYKVVTLDISKNETKEPWFLEICPNGRIPALVDHEEGEFKVWESGAIMWYLAEKYGGLLPKDFKQKTEVHCWLMFQMGGVGPMQGQANHFFKYAPEKIEYGINRYKNETKRLYSVLDDRLKDHEWLAADQFTIADIANFSWVACAPIIEIGLEEFPNVKRWYDQILSRPAVKKGLDVPEKNKLGLT